MIENIKTVRLQGCDKHLSFNQKCGNIVIIFSDEKMFTIDAVVFVEMTYTWQSY